MQTTSGTKRLASGADDHAEPGGEGTEGGRWLISYADLITTMMVLFLALYALQLAKSRQLELRYQTLETQTAQHSVPAPAGGAQQDAHKQLSALLDALREKGLITVTEVPHGVEIAVNAKILFNAGDARLLPDSFEVLNQIAQVLQKDSTGNVLVEGHTDSVPISTAKYASNWELSSARAGAVVRYLVERGIEPHRLAAIGRADNFPLIAGDDAAARAANRRVAIVVQY
ncbi:OmpA family protein [Paraburkholderia sprentiae WSM5005]|uniref:OmpA family protein n=1 Tax=Paraburkholderia sprentiae WSM5005 TaxID=754502 RepID=A0A1I9YGH7_9BURK|nr:OmpA family protein [Paraburkholderia sprentiae]APA85410.1 OmpA family protein [Paraburkholderia sprentiae WSM5005]